MLLNTRTKISSSYPIEKPEQNPNNSSRLRLHWQLNRNPYGFSFFFFSFSLFCRFLFININHLMAKPLRSCLQHVTRGDEVCSIYVLGISKSLYQRNAKLSFRSISSRGAKRRGDTRQSPSRDCSLYIFLYTC